MQGKFHISSNGTPAPCPAKIQCRLGGPEDHYDTIEKAQEIADLKNERDELIKQYKIKPTLGTKIKIKKLNQAMGKNDIDGLYTLEEIAEIDKKKKENEIMMRKMEEEKNKKLENYKNFLKMDTLSLPETLDSNYVLPREKYSKIRLNSKIYRGEMESYDGSTNTGVAMFGKGLYSTTNKKYASLYGKTREVELDETPAIPLVLKDETSFNYFVHETCQKYGFDRSMLEEDISVVVKKMGYDGLVFGPKNDMIIVNYGE